MHKIKYFVLILGELVSRQAKSFDSEFTLLCSDVNIHMVPFPDGSSVGCFRFKIKSPKVDRVGNGDEVEVFQIESGLDPFSALSRYNASSEAWTSYCKIPLIRRRLIASRLSTHLSE